jgi:hypothetical protein
MRIVIALGGNALLRRGEPMTTDRQRANVKIAAQAIAPLAAAGNGIVVVHGNGPQVGLLSLQAESYAGAAPYPLDVLDAGTQGMIGYLIQQELWSLLPPENQVATLLTMVVVDPGDPAFTRPAKFVGPVYGKDAADALAAEKGWTFRPDGPAWRRVVPFGFVVAATVLSVLEWGPGQPSTTHASVSVTMAFAVVSFSAVNICLVMRRERQAPWSSPVFPYLGWIILGWILTWAAVELDMLQRLLGTTSLSGRERVVVLALSLLALAVIAADKVIQLRRQPKIPAPEA